MILVITVQSDARDTGLAAFRWWSLRHRSISFPSLPLFLSIPRDGIPHAVISRDKISRFRYGVEYARENTALPMQQLLRNANRRIARADDADAASEILAF